MTVRLLIFFALLLAFLSGAARATADCSDRIEKQFAPELSGHLDRLLPCKFEILYSLDGDGQAYVDPSAHIVNERYAQLSRRPIGLR